MKGSVNVGDVVLSNSGRDKGKYFLVIDFDGKNALVADGRTRKVKNPKRKNIKHLNTVLIASLPKLANKIRSGEAVGNEVLFRALKAEKQKIQED